MKRSFISSVFALAELVGDIEFEGGVAALVLTDEFAVNVDSCVIVASTDVKKDALSRPICGNLKITLIPYSEHKIGVLNTRKLALGAKRHVYFHIERVAVEVFLRDTRSFVVYFKIPNAV